eukprot:Rmarinus@m.26563
MIMCEQQEYHNTRTMRFAINLRPDIDELVLGQVLDVEPDLYKANISLLEYENIVAEANVCQLQRRKRWPESSKWRPGTRKVFRVTRLDVSAATKTPLSTLCDSLYRPLVRAYGHAYVPLQWGVSDPDRLLSALPILPTQVKQALLHDIKRRLTPGDYHYRALIDVTCFDVSGILSIKEALKAGLACQKEHTHVSIKLDSSPTYDVVVTGKDSTSCEETIHRVILEVQQNIDRLGGKLEIRLPPSLTHDAHRRPAYCGQSNLLSCADV